MKNYQNSAITEKISGNGELEDQNVPLLPATNRSTVQQYRYYIFGVALFLLLFTFWFLTRYPQLLAKASQVGAELPGMAYSSEMVTISTDENIWQQILYRAINWLYSMCIGMSFGVLLGALLHTYLHYYPLKLGRSVFKNSLKGAVIGAPMGICANCAVPTACGVTRGNGRVEMILGFLFSSPNFNPVVVMMTILAFPALMIFTKYTILMLIILAVVPALIHWLEHRNLLSSFSANSEESQCNLPAIEPHPAFWPVIIEMGRIYSKSMWMLIKPTITIMIIASIFAAAIMTLFPWTELLAEVTAGRVALASFIAVLMPVPIAVDILFAAQLQAQGISSGYVMLFAMSLGTYSIIPMIFLWREVSKVLACTLFCLFFTIGFITGMAF